MKHTITVLQDDIDNGTPGSATGCAIALAANRELFRNDVRVDNRVLAAGVEFHASLPEEALRFVPAFDRFMPVEPFKFEIEEVPGPFWPGQASFASFAVTDEVALFAEPFNFKIKIDTAAFKIDTAAFKIDTAAFKIDTAAFKLKLKTDTAP